MNSLRLVWCISQKALNESTLGPALLLRQSLTVSLVVLEPLCMEDTSPCLNLPS